MANKPEKVAVVIYPTGRGHFALGSPDGTVLWPGHPLTVLFTEHAIAGTIRTSELGDYLQAPNGDRCGLCAGMRVIAPISPEREVVR